MIGELGSFCLVLALCVSLFQTVIPLVGTIKNRPSWMNFSRPVAYIQWLLVFGSYCLLTYAFYLNDFSIEYVARTSNLEQPLVYRLSGVWGGHEGSLLLWILMLSSWTALVARFSHGIPQDMLARVIAVLGAVSIGFITFTLFTSNPFKRLFPTPPNGQELNPLLQDPGFLIHPPMLYMGYVGFSVVFAFAIAAMLSGKLDTAWARWSRPWTTVAWLFLTIGIVLGSWWAYYELGWGGWWFWDPVENASFMPWLVGTALIHSLAVTEKRGAFKAWTVFLAVLAFSLSLLGTFLVRSGVLTSVHSFASDPKRGLFILIFLLIVVGGSLLLFALRAYLLVSNARYKLFSKESSLMINNLLLVIAAFMVFLGTLAPIVYDAVGRKISVGAPYFDFMFALLMIPLAIIMGIGSNARWKQDKLGRFTQPVVALAIVSLIVSAVITSYLSTSNFSFGAWGGLALAIWVALWSLIGILERLKNQKNKLAGLRKIPASIWGMTIAHFGLAVFILGVTHVNAYSIEKNIRLTAGESYEIGAYHFTFNGVTRIREHNYLADQGEFIVTQDTRKTFELLPQKRRYSSGSPMTEAAINTNLSRDIFIALGDKLADGSWTVRLYLRSFVACIWLGGFIMAFGGLVSVSDRRFRKPIKVKQQEPSNDNLISANKEPA